MGNSRIRKGLQKLFLAGCLLVLLMPVKGQLIGVRSVLSRDSMMIGEQVDYSIQVDADRDLEFTLPVLQDTLSKTLEVVSRLSSDTVYSENRMIVEQHYRITGFESGSHIVPSQQVLYNRGGTIDTARSMPLIINIYEPAVDTSQQIKPIKPPMNTPVTFREVLPWLGLGIGTLLLAGLITWFIVRYLRNRRYPERNTLTPLEPAHVIAFRELDRLKQEKIWARGKVKEFYTSLTEITRRYIERQYDIPAMESTTEEILHAFGKTNKEDELLNEMLKELLELADLVKFAREDPLPVDNQTNLNNAYIFVQKTYPMFYREESGVRDANHRAEEGEQNRKESDDA